MTYMRRNRWNGLLLRRLCTIVAITLVSPALAGEAIQRGFYSHEPTNIGISGARSGEICGGTFGSDSVCSIATAITVQGQDTC